MEENMKISQAFANCWQVALLSACIAVLSPTTAAQIWIASTGAVDESSTASYLFTGQAAFVRPSLPTGTVILRYNVLPAGKLLTPITDSCCQGRALMVRFMDNGSGAQVLVTLNRYNVHTGQL